MVTEAVAVLDPYSVVAVMVALPSATPSTSPPLVTVAIVGLDDDQVTALLVALAGSTVAVSMDISPTARAIVDLSRLTPVTATVLTFPCKTSCRGTSWRKQQ